jgi:hypothetical protein
MHTDERLEGGPDPGPEPLPVVEDPGLQDLDAPVEVVRVTRWIPSPILDLPPLEPIFGLRTPHRVSLQAMPSSRDALRGLLQNRPFEICIEAESEAAPLRHVSLHTVHEVCLTPDLPLDWNHYYWIADGLQEDLCAAPEDPGSALARGRWRLATVETHLRALRRGTTAESWMLEEVWSRNENALPVPANASDAHQTLQQYVRGLTGHLVAHTGSPAFGDWMADLLREAERQPLLGLPALSAADHELLGTYVQHRLLGNIGLASPSGMIAGWHLLVSATVLGVWYAGLLVHSGYEADPSEALVASLWMLDQGFWCDEGLVFDVLHNLNTSEYTSLDLALALATAMSAAEARA